MSTLAMRRGYSLVGMLVTFACIAMLFAISMTAMNKAVTGEGSATEGSLRSGQDKIQLYAIYQGLSISAGDFRGSLLTPAKLTQTDDVSLNTTANLFSAIVAQRYAAPKALIAGNEFSGYVEEDFDYDFVGWAHEPGMYWDSGFVADLHSLSNNSYAHVPLYGDRLRKFWTSSSSGGVPIMGNRGPKDGVHDPNSMTYGRNGKWGGHIVFGDGHVEYIETFTPDNLWQTIDGESYDDNIFNMEQGAEGDDAVLAFTTAITQSGNVELQYD